MAIERWGSLSATDHYGATALIAKSCFMITSQLARKPKGTFSLWAFAKSLAVTLELIQPLKKLTELQNRAKSDIMSVISGLRDNV